MAERILNSIITFFGSLRFWSRWMLSFTLSVTLVACSDPPAEDDIPPNQLNVIVQPPTTLAAGSELAIKVEVLDFLGQKVITGADATADFAVAILSGTGTLLGTTTVTAVDGVADFTGSGLTFGELGSKSLVVIKDRTPLSPPSSIPLNAFTVIHGPASNLSYVMQPADPTIALLEISSILQIRDAYGNLVITGPDSSANVALAIQSGTGTLTGNINKNAVFGVVDFSGQGVNIDLEGFKTLRATKEDTSGSGGTPSLFVDSNSFEIASPAAHHLALTTQPLNPSVAGSELALVVEIQDIVGNPMTSGADTTANITVTMQSGTGTLGGTMTVAAVAGVATFLGSGLNIDLAGSKVLRITKADTSGSGGTVSFFIDTASFDIVGAAADHLTYISQPLDPSMSGVELISVVEIRDVYENVVTSGADSTASITASLQGGTGALSGTTTFSALAGVIDFSSTGISVDLIGAKTIRASKADTSGSGGTASLFIDSSSFTLVHGPANNLIVSTQPIDPTVAGVTILTAMEIHDAAGNIVTSGVDSTANVTLSLQSGTGIIGGTSTVVAAGGLVSFAGPEAINVDLIGIKTIRAIKADTSGSGGTGALFVDASNFTINHAPASQIVFTTQPADPTNAYDEIAPTLEIQDGFGNIVSTGVDATTSVTLNLQTGTGTLSGTLSLAATGGVANFLGQGVNIDIEGSGKVIRATKADTSGGGGTASLFSDSSPFVISAPQADHITITSQPMNPTVAGSEISLVAEIRDVTNALVTIGADSVADVTLSIFSGTGTLTGIATVSAIGGVADFTGMAVNIDLIGAKVLTVTKADTTGSGGSGVKTLDSNGFNIIHAPASQVQYFTQPADPSTVNVEIPIAVVVLDTYGNLVTTGVDSTANITVNMQAGVGTLSGTLSKVAVAGVADFTGSGVASDTGESGVILRATKSDTTGSGGTLSAFIDSNSFTVDWPSATQLVFTTLPSDPSQAGADLLPVIEIQDGTGAALTGGPDSTANITISLQSGTGALSGTITIATVNGVASFTAIEALNINLIGSKILRATKADTTGSGGTGTLTTDTPSFTIVHGAASQMVYSTQPSDPTVVDDEIPVGLLILDSFGNAVTTGVDSTSNITMSMQIGTGTLSGTQTVAAVGGFVDFTGSSLATDTGESGVVLRATKADTTGSGGTVSTFKDSNAFNVNWIGTSQLVFTSQPADPTVAGVNILPVIEIRDAGGSPITQGPDATANITLSLQTGTGVFAGTVTVAAVNGVATFTATEAVNIDLVGSKIIRATKADTSGAGGTGSLFADSSSFTINHAPASQLSFLIEPTSPTTVLADILPSIEILDLYGNIVLSGVDSTANITLTLQAGTGNLAGTVTLAAVAGVATFTATEAVNIDDIGIGKILRATKADTTGSGGTASTFKDSAAFEIVAGAAAQIAFTTQPNDPTGAGADILPVIEVQDSSGFVINTGVDSTANITLNLQSGTGPFAGTLTVAAVNGVATFTATEGVNIDLLGAKIIRATKADTSGSGGTASVFVDSSSFNITHGPASQIVYTTGPLDPTPINSNILMDLEIRDSYGNIVNSGADSSVGVTLSIVSGTGSLLGTLTKSASLGLVSFSATEAVQINMTGVGKIIRASKADTTGGGGTAAVSIDSLSFTVNSFPAPSGLVLKTPATSPGVDKTPEITISGVTIGNTVTLYKDSACSGTVIASGVAAATSIDLISSSNLLDGTYDFYANQDDGAQTSPCSTATVQYVLSTVPPPLPSLLLLYSPIITPEIDDTPTIQISGVTSGHTIRLFRDSSCATEVGSGVASGASIEITSSLLPADGVYDFYATAEFSALNSGCSLATVQYELDSTLIPVAMPTGLILYDPLVSPGDDPTPIIEVSGVVSGDSVFLYTDNLCTSQVGFNTANNTTVLVQSGGLANGTYNFYATRNNSGGTMSTCSSATVVYEVNVVPPTAPTALTLHSPAITPSNDATPTILIDGVSAGNSVKLFSDSSCTTQVGVSTATATTIQLTSSSLAEGVYDFYALQTNGPATSPCSTATVSYEYSNAVTIPDPPTSLVLSSPAFSPDVDTTPTITVNGVANGDTVKIFSDSNCATEIGSGVSTGASVDLTTSVLSIGAYNIYANRTDTIPETSNCSPVYVAYEVTDTIQLDDFEAGFGNWINVGGDDRDWSVNSGTTASTDVGPSSGYGGAGQYAYTEASSPVAAGEIFNLESNSLDAGANQLAVSFKWNKRGTSMGNLYLEVSTDGGTTWDAPIWTHLGVDTATGPTDVWKNGAVDLCGLGYTSGNVKMRFRGEMPASGTVWNSDMGIDQVRVYTGSCSPPLSVAVTNPSTNFIIDRTNYYSYPLQGTCSQSGGSIEISGEISASTTCFSGSWSTSLNFTSVSDGPINLSIRHIFGTQEGSTSLTLTLDTTMIQQDDFENGYGNWLNVAGDDSDWTLQSSDTPSTGVGPSSGLNGSGQYLYTEASAPIGNGDLFNLESNTLDAGSDSLEVTFNWNKRGDTMGDLFLEVSTDGGTTWNPLWNHAGVDVAKGAVDVWQNSTVDICALGYNTGSIKLRFRGVMPLSGNVWNSDMGLDSISIKDGDCL